MINNFFRWILALAAISAVVIGVYPSNVSAHKQNPFLTPTPTSPIPARPVLVVLGYHQIGSDDIKGDPTYRLTPEELQWEFQWIKDHGWKVVTLDQVMDHWEKGAPLPDKSVLLTYDDGYRSVFKNGFPVMRQFGYSGVLFPVTDFIRYKTGLGLRTDDILAMQKAGLSVQSHSQTHPHSCRLKETMEPKDYADFLKGEMENSRDYLSGILKTVPKAFAYPYGEYNFDAVDAARAAGYRMAFTVNPGANDATTDPFHIHRYLVLHDITHAGFAGFFEDQVLHVGKVEPADGETIDVRNPVFRAHILDDVDPNSVRIFLGDKPLNRVQYSPSTGRVLRPLRIRLARGGHMVTLKAVDRKGVTRTYSWYFRIKKYPKKKPRSKLAKPSASASAPPAMVNP